MSIRLRLTLLYSTILALTLIVFSGTLYAIQARYTLAIVQGDLALPVRRLAAELTRMLSEPDQRRPFFMVGPPDVLAGDRGPSDWQPMALREFRTRDTVRLLDADGSPLDLTLNEDTEDLSPSKAGLEQLQSGQEWTEIVHGEEGRLLVHSAPVQAEGQLVAIVQMARPLTDRDRSLQALGLALTTGSLLTILVAFGIGWVLAGVTLRPIHRITQTAQEIGRTRDFSSRVQHRGPDDELGRLAKTFNGMLDRLQDAYQQVAHSLQVQRDFVADVSHELRTPLTTVRGNLELLNHTPPLPGAEQEDILQDLVGESDRLIRLTTDLLTLARADAGRKLSCEPVAVGPLIDDVCRQAQLLEPARRIQCDGLEEATALADRDALKQVLLILLDNAIKHTQGPIQVALEKRERRVAVSVQDSGPGMTAEQCERAFDRFYQGDNSRSTPGFGLGLSIARTLVEAQEGSIDLQSEVEAGSTFTVWLPAPT